MAVYVLDDDRYANYNVNLTAPVYNFRNGDSFTLTAGHTMSTTNTNVYFIAGDESNISVTIAGSLVTAFLPVALGSIFEGNNQLNVTSTGKISSTGSGLEMWGSASTLTNAGTISASRDTIAKWLGEGTGAFTINNEATGKITSSAVAIEVNSSSEKTIINNEGSIKGVTAFTIDAISAAVEIHNSGKITGALQLGVGNDIYDGALGTLTGTLDGNAGRDKLTGGWGADKIIGGAGRDVMAGGAGADRFIFEAATDSFGAMAQVDLINGFSQRQGDLIDLELVDANVLFSKDQDFTFIGASTTAGKTGQLWFRIVGETTYVYGNTDRDSDAEFGLALAGKINLVATNFDL